MKNDKILEKIKQDLINNYKCHTIILYGSRARDEATSTSDYDIIAIRDNGELERDCQLIENFYLDIFVYSIESIQNPDISLIRIKDGIVLCQKDNIGDDLLNKIKIIFQAGPPVTPNWEKHEMNTWIMKMLNRSKNEDIEGNFRRHWLLHGALECYFKLRDKWYLGPKESFQWLMKNDKNTYDAFEDALKNTAPHNSIEKLILRIRT